MGKLRRFAKGLYGVLGVCVFVIALADIPAKLTIWSGWLAALSPHLHTLTFRWILGCGGVLVCLAPWIAEWCRSNVRVLLAPTSGPRPEMELRVTNKGSGREFYAQCDLLSLRNSPNPLARVSYSFKWESTDNKRLFLEKGESANLLIARTVQDHKNAFAEMELVGLYGKELKRYEWAGWNVHSKEAVPEYDLKVSIFSDGTKKPLEHVYTLKPKTVYGPLEMVELVAGVRA